MPAIGVALALSLVASVPSSAQAGDDTWQSSTWTGVVPGAPVPGGDLPSAPVPAPLTPMPPDVNPVISYEPQTTCDPGPKPGALRLQEIITTTYGAGQTVWIPRGCNVGPTSEHKEGRAVDWMVSVRNRQDRANAEAFLNWLLGPDSAGRVYGHALQLGVMYIGWHDRIWRGYGIDRGWQELKGCFSKGETKYDNYCHRNHIHISLTRMGATGADPTGAPIPVDPSAPPPPEAPLVEPELVDQPLAPAQPGPDDDLFMAIGSELGYSSFAEGPLQPGRLRTVNLGPVPVNATSALVTVTTRRARSDTKVRVGLVGQKGNAVALRAPKSQKSSSVVSVPVADGALQLRSAYAPVDVRIDVLGYAVDGGVYPAVGTVARTLREGRFAAGSVTSAKVRGVGSVPRQKGRVTAVILRVTAEGRGEAGRFTAYPAGGADLGTTSAVVPASGAQTSVVVADVGRNGRVALTSSVPTKAKVEVVGYVSR